MNNRLCYQMTKVERVLPILDRAHVPVYRIELDANRPTPILHTGAGPFDWVTIAFGRDQKGDWSEVSAWLRGVELRQRRRRGRALQGEEGTA